MREVVASLCLIPMGLECGTQQVYLMIRLTLNQVRNRDLSRIRRVVDREAVSSQPDQHGWSASRHAAKAG